MVISNLKLEEGLSLDILTNVILRKRDSPVHGLTLIYKSSSSDYEYLVLPLNRLKEEYIPMDSKWFSWEVQQLSSAIRIQGDPEYKKKKDLFSLVSYTIPLKDYINSYNLQVAVDALLAESNYQRLAEGLFLVSEKVNGSVFLRFWYEKIRRDLYEIKTGSF